MKIGFAYWLAHLVNLELLLLKSCLDMSRISLLLKDTVAIVLFVDVVHIEYGKKVWESSWRQINQNLIAVNIG